MSDASQQHKGHADADIQKIKCAIITSSDNRTKETDTSGQYIHEVLGQSEYEIIAYEVVKDEPDLIGNLIDTFAEDAHIILINGGTGIHPRDNTFDAVNSRLEKVIPGFGELFRMLSYEEIGSDAMLSRAVAGVYRKTIVVSMPGSSNAVKLAMDKLIMPEIKHLTWEMIGRTQSK